MSPERAFGETIKQLRTEKRMSQEALALASGFDRSYISQVECGLKSPTIGTVFKISSALEVQVSEIMALVEERIQYT